MELEKQFLSTIYCKLNLYITLYVLKTFCANARPPPPPPPGEFRFVQIPAGPVGILCKTPAVAGRCSRLELIDALQGWLEIIQGKEKLKLILISQVYG